jgi:superfamily I DNA/RNA helicase
VAFLGESLRALSLDEARANVCVIARDAERADLYFHGLERAEIPRLSRVRDQDFSFRPGVEVTDIRQVKGLEFDYVILVDVTASQYPVDDESRHLLHIGATRAAHQLWVPGPRLRERLPLPPRGAAHRRDPPGGCREQRGARAHAHARRPAHHPATSACTPRGTRGTSRAGSWST